jgi:hypothetical protein
LSEPITIGAQLCAPIPAVGIALWRSPDDDADGLLEDAGWELREVRRRTGKGWRIAHSTDEPQDEGASHGVRHRGFRFRAFLQRTVGWLSLLTIGWVVASYSGIERAKTLLGQIHQLLLSIPPLR